jgi:hypothetical protein
MAQFDIESFGWSANWLGQGDKPLPGKQVRQWSQSDFNAVP